MPLFDLLFVMPFLRKAYKRSQQDESQCFVIPLVILTYAFPFTEENRRSLLISVWACLFGAQLGSDIQPDLLTAALSPSAARFALSIGHTVFVIVFGYSILKILYYNYCRLSTTKSLISPYCQSFLSYWCRGILHEPCTAQSHPLHSAFPDDVSYAHRQSDVQDRTHPALPY